MIKTSSKLTIKLPNLDFTKNLMDIAKTVIIPDIRFGINRSVGIDNKPFPQLEPSTIAKKSGVRKRAIKSGGLKKQSVAGARGGAKQLVDTGVLQESFEAERVKTNHVRISIDSDRDKIGYYLQKKGVGKKRKTFNFFGVSQRAELQSISKMKGAIGQALGEVNGR